MQKKWKCYLPVRERCKFMFSRHVQILMLICGFLNLSSCKDDPALEAGKYNPGQPVMVSNILPETGGILTPVVIEGQNFGTDKTKVQVFFNEREALVINVVNEYIYALVPKCSGGDNTVKVIIDGQNEGILQSIKFDYVIASKVTSVASEFTNDLDYLMDISIDEEENLIICQKNMIKLYSIKDDKMVIILPNLGINFQGGCFSADFNQYYALPANPNNALIIVLNKKSNWEREMIYDTEKVGEEMSASQAVTTDDNGFIYIYGTGKDGGGIVLKVDPESHKVQKLGKISVEKGRSMSFNPKDKFIYMSVTDAGQIIRFDSQKTTLGGSDWEAVTGERATNYKDGILSEATFCYPLGLEFDHDNNLYVADETGYTIRKIDLTHGIVSTFAGKMNGPGGFVNGSAEDSRFNHPTNVAVTPDGLVYVMEYFEPWQAGQEEIHRLRCVAIQ